VADSAHIDWTLKIFINFQKRVIELRNPIVILKGIDGERTIALWIGFIKAQAIARDLEGIKFSRPSDAIPISWDGGARG